MILARETVGFRITFDPDGTVNIQPEFARPFDPMGVSLPLELAAIRSKFSEQEIRQAIAQCLIPTRQDPSGLRVMVLCDVVEGDRRLREERGR